ncbi:MAG TPA: PTS system mannose/fructose/sorbose family transporter subunit IID [Gemmatimonadaceae bacterium]|nr:PTS system mannose/fructose/sorbose family transporter subunit IID [Gemmatimonadaceae bacterium]
MTAAPTPRPFPAPAPTPHVSPRTWVTVFSRLLAIQGSWNYETLIGNGIGFCTEPALRSLPGGVGGAAFKAAMARESAYFNAHPYLAAVAVGALARAELSGVPPARIERFRIALCGPLGSVGDQLVWAGWLPFCSLVALAAYGLGARPLIVVVTFLALYNAGHLALRAWGLHVGWTRGLGVASALANPILRRGPAHVARAAAAAAGIAIPLTAAQVVDGGPVLLALALAAAAAIAAMLVRLHGRVEGWKLSLVLIALFALISVAR